MADELLIRAMTRGELDTLVGWAADEGWNPGLDDADVFWATDPEAFIAAELDGELVGGGAIVSYERQYGFMGLFIVRKDHRGHGLGDQLWHERKRRLLARLDEPRAIGLEGVFAMQGYYARGGFQFVCRDLRFEGRAERAPEPEGVVDLGEVPFAEVEAYDRRHFPALRPAFLERWIARPGGHAVGIRRNGRLAAISVLRPCRTGFKIGPLFADDEELAERMFVAVGGRVPGAPIFLDTPEDNPAALELARRHGMKEVFGCARMFLGTPPTLPTNEVFGITTFELG